MARKVITNLEIAKSPAFSPAIQVGPMVYVSGAGAKDLTKDCKGQSEEVFTYISKVLEAAGCSFKDVVKIQAFVAKQSDYQAYNDVRRKIFPKDPPASTTVVAGLVRPEMLVEVEVVAYKEGAKW